MSYYLIFHNGLKIFLLVMLAFILSSCTLQNKMDLSAQIHSSYISGTNYEVLGRGNQKIALMVPRSSGGNVGKLASDMVDVARLAVKDLGENNLSVVVMDTKSNHQQTEKISWAAMKLQVKGIIGPLFAKNVLTVGKVVSINGLPILGLSSNSRIAGAARNIYLMSFLPRNEVNRIISFASKRGKKSLGVVIPESSYGFLIEGLLKTIAANNGVRIVFVERIAKDNSNLAAIASKVSSFSKGDGQLIDSLFLPLGKDSTLQLVKELSVNGVNFSNIQLLGVGLWDIEKDLGMEALSGAWFSAPERDGYQSLSSRFSTIYGRKPDRKATLVYDAVTFFAYQLIKGTLNNITPINFANKRVFSGIDGLFRFNEYGQIDRLLAILQYDENGDIQVLEKAPLSFGRS